MSTEEYVIPTKKYQQTHYVMKKKKKKNQVIQSEDWYIWLGTIYLLSSLPLLSECVNDIHTVINMQVHKEISKSSTAKSFLSTKIHMY